ncbi:MAG: hypothetical protein ABFD54_04380 [Armatimonadota bacterium]
MPVVDGKFIETERPGVDSPASKEQLCYLKSLRKKKFRSDAEFLKWAREQLHQTYRVNELTVGDASKLIGLMRPMPDWAQPRLFDI